MKTIELLPTKLIGFTAFMEGYSKAQETYNFSKEDIVSFAYFYFTEEFNSTMQDCKSTDEIFQLWKEHKIKTIYYE